MSDVEVAAIRWLLARTAILELAALPIGNAAYREALNELSESEDVLATAVRKIR